MDAEQQEDLVDDLLYYARVCDLDELKTALDQLSKKFAAPPHDVLNKAIDSESGNSVLHMAAANGHIGRHNFEQSTPFDLCFSLDIIKLVLSLTPVPATSDVSASNAQVPQLINLPNKSGNTPLHWAALNGHLEGVKVLVDAGADLLAKNNAGHDVVYEAELAGKEDVVNWLLSAGKEDQIAQEEEVDEKELEGPSETAE
jgi:uncharacterized protein